jgi:hypothetical protein
MHVIGIIFLEVARAASGRNLDDLIEKWGCI